MLGVQLIVSQPPTFHKTVQCDRCQFYSDSLYLRCALHPTGQLGGNCLDFREDPTAHQSQAEFLSLVWVTGEEFRDVPIDASPFEDGFQWEPEGASYYAGELIIDVVQRFNREQKLELLDQHPMFTGRCPECESVIARSSPAQTHWDCQYCGWKDNSI